MLRELSSLERGLTRSDLYAPFNVVSVARFSGPLTIETLRAALDHLQRRHALLDATVQYQDGRFWFSVGTRAPLQLQVLSRESESSWLAAVEAELPRRIPAASGPLLRCLFLPPGEEGRGEIILTYHHAIMDASASVVLWRELLEACAELAAGRSLPGSQPAAVPPLLDSRLPVSERGLRGSLRLLRYALAGMWDEAAFAMRMLGKPRPRVRSGGQGRVVPLVLEPGLTEALGYACRQRGVTFNSALNAAMLLAVNRKLYGGAKLLMRTMAAADLRPFLTPPVAEPELGAYFALMRYTVRTAGSMDLWTLAGAVNEAIYASLKSGDKFAAPHMIELLVRVLTWARRFRFSNAALSFGGLVSIPTRYGELRLDELHGFLSGFELSPELGADAILFEDRLICDLVYLDTDMDPLAAQALVEELRRILVEAAG